MRKIDADPAGAPQNDAPMRLVCLALVLALVALLLRIVTVEMAFASGPLPAAVATAIREPACLHPAVAFSGCSPIAVTIGRSDRRPIRLG